MSPFSQYLSQQAQAQAHWGMMDIHNMIEHLALTLQMSVGERKTTLQNSEDKANKLKRIMVYSDRPMPKGVKTSMLPEDNTLPYINKSYAQAIEYVEKALIKFNQTLENTPEKEYMHPTMGLLNMQEWQKLHLKHFTHHFEQFGLDILVLEKTFG